MDEEASATRLRRSPPRQGTEDESFGGTGKEECRTQEKMSEEEPAETSREQVHASKTRRRPPPKEPVPLEPREDTPPILTLPTSVQRKQQRRKRRPAPATGADDNHVEIGEVTSSSKVQDESETVPNQVSHVPQDGAKLAGDNNGEENLDGGEQVQGAQDAAEEVASSTTPRVPEVILSGEDIHCCEVCHGTSYVLMLKPCGHWALCEDCMNRLLNTSEEAEIVDNEKAIRCPVCAKFVRDSWNRAQERAARKAAAEAQFYTIDWEKAKRKGRLSTAGVKIMKKIGMPISQDKVPDMLGIYTVADNEIGEVFGAAVAAAFSQPRILSFMLFLWSLAASPLAMAYILTNIYAPFAPLKNATLTSDFLSYSEQLLKAVSMPTCEISDCKLYNPLLDWFLVGEICFSLIAALVAWWLVIPREDFAWDVLLARRTLLIIQAEHLSDSLNKEALLDFFREEQRGRNAAWLQRLESCGQRPAFSAVDPNKVEPVHVLSVINGSAKAVAFARAAQERQQLHELVLALRGRVRAQSSTFIEHHWGKAALANRKEQLRKVDREFFDDLFFEEELGGPRDRHDLDTNFSFVLFETAEDCALARRLLTFDPSSEYLHNFYLMFGAAACPLRCLGSEEEVYPSNIDWMALARPRWYSMGSGPAWFALGIFGLLMTLHLGGFILWAPLGSFFGAVVLVLWQELSKWILYGVVTWYGHPLKSIKYTRFVLLCVFGIYVPSYLLWPLLASPQDKPFLSPAWWDWRGTSTLLFSELIHLARTLLWWVYGQRIYVKFQHFVRGAAYTQEHADLKYRPVEWDLGLSYVAFTRCAIVCILYSTVAPALLAIGSLELALLYASEKLHFCNFCSPPPVVWDRRVGNTIAFLVEVCILGRTLISSMMVLGLFNKDGSAYEKLIDVPDWFHWPLVTVAGVGSVLFLCIVYMHRIPLVYWATWYAVTCADNLFYIYRNDRDARRLSKYKARFRAPSKQAEFDLVKALDFQNFPRFKALFSEVYTTADLEKWGPDQQVGESGAKRRLSYGSLFSAADIAEAGSAGSFDADEYESSDLDYDDDDDEDEEYDEDEDHEEEPSARSNHDTARKVK